MAIYDIFGGLVIPSVSKSPLTGANWLPIGDSITNNGSYRDPIRAQYGMTVLSGGYGDGYQVGYKSGAAYCALEKITNLPDTKPDIITIALGTNDFGKTPIGEIADGADKATVENYTFCGCYKQLIERLHTKYGNVPMVLITPFPRGGGWNKDTLGNTLRDYADAIVEIGAYYSIPVCDMNRYSGLSIGTLNGVSEAYTSDGLHLSGPAGGVVGPKIAKAMEFSMLEWVIPCDSLKYYIGGKYVGTPVNIEVGGAAMVYGIRSPTYTTHPITWETSNSKIATATTAGNYAACTIDGVSAGTCRVTARCGDVELVYDVTVT